MKYAVPAYITLFFIPFTYSILRGVAFGYIVYIFLMLFTGDFITESVVLYRYIYCNFLYVFIRKTIYFVISFYFQVHNRALCLQGSEGAVGRRR